VRVWPQSSVDGCLVVAQAGHVARNEQTAGTVGQPLARAPVGIRDGDLLTGWPATPTIRLMARTELVTAK
jgi:hypothetical protein